MVVNRRREIHLGSTSSIQRTTVSRALFGVSGNENKRALEVDVVYPRHTPIAALWEVTYVRAAQCADRIERCAPRILLVAP